MSEHRRDQSVRPTATDPDDLLDIAVGKPRDQQVPRERNQESANAAPRAVGLANREGSAGQNSAQAPHAAHENGPVPSTEPTPALVTRPRGQEPGPATDAAQAPPAAASPVHLEQRENWLVLLVKETLETVVLAVIIFLLIRIGIQNYRIEGSSMEPNFHNGEYLLVNKLAYRLGEYHRGDVIVFKFPGDPSKDYIKRVVGLPGDTVEIRDRTLYVNGIPVHEPYAVMPMTFPKEPTVVEPGHLYVLGDNRPASSDSRDWGLLSQDLVIGKAWLAIFPLDTFGLVEHAELELTPEMAQGP